MELLKLIELVAASWYVAYVLINKGGPFNWFARAREWREGRWHGRTTTFHVYTHEPITKQQQETIVKGESGLLDCIICILPYVGFGWWLIDQVGADVVMIPFAISGLALWAHSYTGWIHFGGK